MINALKLARSMREAGMPEKQSEALAEALNEGMAEKVVTRDVLSLTIAEFRTEMADFKGEIRAELAEFKGEIRAELAEFKGEIRAELAEFKGEIRAELAKIRMELAQLSITLTNKMYGVAVGIVTATGLIQYFLK